MKYFSTSTKQTYGTLDEAVEKSIAFNMAHGITKSEIIGTEGDSDVAVVHGRLERLDDMLGMDTDGSKQ